MSSTLRGSERPPAECFDVALLDLDGVVYIGKNAVPAAPAALQHARSVGMQLAFVTNNAARPPSVVAAHLTELGIAARADEVITSSQAAARYLAEHLPAGSLVLVLGTTGLYEALAEQGLRTTDTAVEQVAAVVQGYSPDMNWALLAEGAVGINSGALWVATNIDPTVPSPRGPLPGNGSLVAAMSLATRRQPVITGKPDPTMHRETMIRTGAENPLVVGDRLDTDIEGANAVGCASLLVFSGVTDVPDLLAAPAALRPTFIGADVGAMLVRHPQPETRPGGASCGAWHASVLDAGLRLEHIGGPTVSVDGGTGAPGAVSGTVTRGAIGSGAGFDGDALDAVRALCAARWEHDDSAAESPQGSAPLTVTAGDERATAMLATLGLAG